MKVDKNSIRKVTNKIKYKLQMAMYDENEITTAFGDYITRYIRENLELNGNVHTSALLNSVTSKYSNKDNMYVVMMDKHWKYIEYGTSPHNAPTTPPLVMWVKDKYIPYKRGKVKLNQAVYLFIKHIREFGTQPYPFVRQALLQAKKKLLEEYETKIKGHVKIVER